MNGDEEERQEWEGFNKDTNTAMGRDRDKAILRALRMEGFCLGYLTPIGPPEHAPVDFTRFVPVLEGCPNLVVVAHHLTQQKVEQIIRELPDRQFRDWSIRLVPAVRSKVPMMQPAFDPQAANWFQFRTEIVIVDGAQANPPLAPGGPDGHPWAHCAHLQIRLRQNQRKLRVIHVGLGPSREMVFLHFLTPHGLVPKKVLL